MNRNLNRRIHPIAEADGLSPKKHRKARKEMFRVVPPKIVYVSSSRLKCARNGDFEKSDESATAYAWFLWEKGFKDKPIIKWFN